jgi:hypothetical protein
MPRFQGFNKIIDDFNDVLTHDRISAERKILQTAHFARQTAAADVI